MKFGLIPLSIFAGASLLTVPSTVSAQGAADAGSEQRAAPPVSVKSRELAASGFVPKLIPPSMLSEGVQARLAERAAAKGGAAPPSLTAPSLTAPSLTAPSLTAPSLTALAGAEAPSALGRLPSEEARRRGEARMRRVQSFETDEGVTILSNRVSAAPQPGAARDARLMMVAEMPVAQPSREGETLVERPQLTEVHSLRSIASASIEPEKREDNWFGWPLLLVMGVSAVAGTVWFNMKTRP